MSDKSTNPLQDDKQPSTARLNDKDQPPEESLPSYGKTVMSLQSREDKALDRLHRKVRHHPMRFRTYVRPCYHQQVHAELDRSLSSGDYSNFYEWAMQSWSHLSCFVQDKERLKGILDWAKVRDSLHASPTRSLFHTDNELTLTSATDAVELRESRLSGPVVPTHHQRPAQ
jgi:hypothetical protein